MAVAMWDPLALEMPSRLRRWLDLDGQMGHWMRIEELRDDDELVIRAELPGVDPDHDLEITLEDGMLHLSAHREERHAKRTGREVRSEFRYGELFRDVPIPEGVKAEDVEARYHDGILEVRVPCERNGQAQRTKVPIEHS